MTEAPSATIPDDGSVAIFVRAEDPFLPDHYGPLVKRAIVCAILAVDELRLCQFQTYWGSLILPARRWASASSGLEGEMTLQSDPFLLWSSACALCRVGEDRWSMLDASGPWLLGTSNVYVCVISRLQARLRGALDTQLRTHEWYIGAMEIDVDNHLHREVFSLIPGWRYSCGWVDQPGQDDIPLAEIFSGTAVYGFNLKRKPISEHHCRIPWGSDPNRNQGQPVSPISSNAAAAARSAAVS